MARTWTWAVGWKKGVRRWGPKCWHCTQLPLKTETDTPGRRGIQKGAVGGGRLGRRRATVTRTKGTKADRQSALSIRPRKPPCWPPSTSPGFSIPCQRFFFVHRKKWLVGLCILYNFFNQKMSLSKSPKVLINEYSYNSKLHLVTWLWQKK